MPKNPKRHDPEAACVRAITEAVNEFEAGFRRSQKGNLCREYEGQKVTVYCKSSGRYGWVISDGENPPRYSPADYEDEELALAVLGGALGLLG